MTSLNEKSGSWSWMALLVLLLLLVAIPLLRKKKEGSHKALSQVAFQIPQWKETSLQEDPYYVEEVIDPQAPYSMAHVASMSELADGTLAALWYGGSRELASDVALYFATKAPGDSSWSKLKVVMTREQAAQELHTYVKGLGNALLFGEREGALHLLYVTVSFGQWSGSRVNMTSSSDGGQHWKKSTPLYLSPFFNLATLVKNTPLPLLGGGWAIPIYQEFLGKFPEILWLFPSTNDSYEIRKSRIAGGCSFFQPSLCALTEKKALCFCRDYRSARKIWCTETLDTGKTWAPAHPIDLPNYDSAVAALALDERTILLAFNDGDHQARNQLSLALSKDEGHSWIRLATIAQEPQGDFCYPYFFRSHDGLIHLLYSWQRRNIHHISLNKAWIDHQLMLSSPPLQVQY